MTEPLVISYYTNEKYRLQAEEMAETARKVGLQVKLYSRPHPDVWWKATNLKCEVVLGALKENGRRPVLFMDADTRFRQYPVLFNTLDADFAAFFMQPTIPSGGCVWFNGHRGLRYAEAWVKNVTQYPKREDDSINFSQAIFNTRPSSIYRLPPSYNWNEGGMRSSFPAVVPVIEHLFVGHHNYPVERKELKDGREGV